MSTYKTALDISEILAQQISLILGKGKKAAIFKADQFFKKMQETVIKNVLFLLNNHTTLFFKHWLKIENYQPVALRLHYLIITNNPSSNIPTTYNALGTFFFFSIEKKNI